MLHLFAMLVAATTGILIFAGGLVTSTESGLSVPDWPNTYGYFMFFFPLEKMVGGIRYEHTHRLIASTVGFLILVLAAWLWRSETRGWVRRLGYHRARRRDYARHPRRHHGALVSAGSDLDRAREPGADRLLSDDDDRAGHVAGLEARLRGQEGTPLRRSGRQGPAPDDRILQRVAAVTTGLIYLQIVVGATMRHTGAGLAIPDFPLMFGQLIPPHWDPKIAIHFAHRVGARHREPGDPRDHRSRPLSPSVTR